MNLLEKYRPVWAPDAPGGGSSAPAGSSGGGGGGTSSGASAPSSTPSSPTGGGTPQSNVATPSSPSGSPAGAGEAQPSTTPDNTFSGDFSFETIFGDGLEGSPPVGGEAPPAAPTPTPTQPTTPPPAAAAPVAEVPVVPGSAPAQAPAGQVAPGAGPPPQGQEAPALDPYNPGHLAQHLAGVEAQATEFVASQMFALTPEEREVLEQDVTVAIPKLMAKVFVKSQQNVLQQLDRLIPVMVQRHTDAMRRNGVGEDKFYARWPNIGRENADLVNRYASVYRQMHPTANLEQMIEDVGPIVMMAARIAPPSAGGPVPGTPARQAAPAANGRSPQPTPFVPAGSGSGPASQPKTQELNPWEAMFVGRE